MSKIERALRKAEEEKRKKPPEKHPPDTDRENILVTPTGMLRPVKERPDMSHLSEAFRKVAARLKSCCENMEANDVVFASAVSGEGKTTTAINCAVSLCNDFNLSVCLIDCDLRNPKVSEYFASNGSPGIVEALRGEAEPDGVVQSTSLKGFSVVLSRRMGNLSLPLLNSQRLDKLVRELRRRFDFVIFDSSPLLPLADTPVLTKIISGIVLVIESGRTRRKHIEQIYEQVDPAKVLGFIMNYKKHRVPESYNYSKYYDYGAKE